MNSAPLDKQSSAADDTHIVRIVRLETQMDNVTSAITSLQHTVEHNHQAMQAQFEVLRDKVDKSEWRLLDRMDRQFYWLMGFVMANVIATVGLLVRLLVT